MKIIGMIPARLGSTRVKNKNLRLMDKLPLIQYVVESAKKSKYLDELYINSESSIFQEIADRLEVKFYLRDKELSSDTATNDDFAYDFIKKIDGDILIQLLPTSPFIESDQIDEFIEKMIKDKFDTMVSVSDIQIESMFKNEPLNFERLKKTPPSQSLEPIKAYACGIMGWKYKEFKKNHETYGAAYHGGNGHIGYYTLKGYSTVDIDNEEDFLLAEAILKARKMPNAQPEYYNSNSTIADANRERILKQDGVTNNFMKDYNKEISSIDEIINSKSTTESWSYTVVNSPSNCATLIAQMPGEGNRRHFHSDWDEWWYIIAGQWEWDIEGKPKIVKKGDVVFINRNRIHKITAVGDKMAIRLAVSRADVDHIYQEEDF